jgi:hypothetical protein
VVRGARVVTELETVAAAWASAGRFHIASVPDGRYYLLSAALPLSADPLALLPESTWRVGSVEAPLLVRGGRAAGHVDLTRPPPRLTDPPLVVAPPFLLTERQPARYQAFR